PRASSPVHPAIEIQLSTHGTPHPVTLTVCAFLSSVGERRGIRAASGRGSDGGVTGRRVVRDDSYRAAASANNRLSARDARAVPGVARCAIGSRDGLCVFVTRSVCSRDRDTTDNNGQGGNKCCNS